MPIFAKALAAQQPQQPQMPAQPPQQLDPVAELMAEYKRLEADVPAKPMFSPEERQQRVQQNQNLSGLGVLGQLSGDQGVQNVGGQVFKQALANRNDRVTDRGIMNPLTGEENLDPEYIRGQQQTRRGQILQRALLYQQSREASADRKEIAKANNDARVEAAQIRADAKNASGGLGHNMTVVKDDVTGESYWADPRTGQTVGKVTTPTSTPGGPTPVVRPDKMAGVDEKSISDLVKQTAAINSALSAVDKHPESFGPWKGSPDLAGSGLTGTVARAMRDRSLTPDQVAARALVYNNMSAIIKDRAGTAQSAQELKRLNGFLPSEIDDAKTIKAKFDGFQTYLKEQEAAVRSKYRGPRPMAHMGDSSQPQAPGSTSTPVKRLKFNPATGAFDDH